MYYKHVQIPLPSAQTLVAIQPPLWVTIGSVNPARFPAWKDWYPIGHKGIQDFVLGDFYEIPMRYGDVKSDSNAHGSFPWTNITATKSQTEKRTKLNLVFFVQVQLQHVAGANYP